MAEDGLKPEVLVSDEGPGVSDSGSLLVCYFTTKPNGSGIGLALSRQIAKAHKGTLTLQHCQPRPSCVALPLQLVELLRRGIE